MSHKFLEYLKENGILPQWTLSGTPQHNGVSERRNHTLLDMVQSMMSLANLPKMFWGYALNTVIYTLNRVPSKSIGFTPYEIWCGRKPSINHLKVWGCHAYVKRDGMNKLGARFNKYHFVGYPKETIGYYFYHPLEKKVFISKHAMFLKNEILLGKDSGRKIDLDES